MSTKVAKFIYDYSLIPASIVFFLFMTLLLRVIHSQLPEWIMCILSVLIYLLALWSVSSIILRRQKKLFQEEKQKMDSLTLEDFQKMYGEYSNLVEEQIRLQNYNREFIDEKWLEKYHKLFYMTSRMLDRTKFTDFHIAACMIFALVSKDDSLSHMHFVYDCIASLISSPRVYLRRYGYAGMITLEVEETFLGTDIECLEQIVSTDEICKIIKDLYVHSHREYSHVIDNEEYPIIELADFLKRLYDRCR